VSADVSQLLALAAELEAAGVEFEMVVGEAVKSTTEALAKEISARAPRDTGNLAGSITATYVGQLFGQVDIGEYYWRFQENGWESGDAFHAPQPFVGPASDAAEPKLASAVEQALGGLLL
jgi:HK97 gp10 family phage protein